MLLGNRGRRTRGEWARRRNAAKPKRAEGAQLRFPIELDAGSAQQSAIVRGGVGAQLQHLTARMVFHVHLLSARVGVAMKTYWRPNDETFGQERNEPAWPLLVRVSSAQAPPERKWKTPLPTAGPASCPRPGTRPFEADDPLRNRGVSCLAGARIRHGWRGRQGCRSGPREHAAVGVSDNREVVR